MVRQTAIFDDFANAILSSHLPPLVSATLSVNVIDGIVGSASGGLQVWMSSFAQDYLRAGVDPEVLHRVATIASGRTGLASSLRRRHHDVYGDGREPSASLQGLRGRDRRRARARVLAAVVIVALALALALEY